jgi:hypothetical protein
MWRSAEEAAMNKQHIVENVRFRQGRLCLVVDGTLLECPLDEVSPKLASASKLQRETFEISPSGYGIHWPLIDEDLSINGLLRTNPKPLTQPTRKHA